MMTDHRLKALESNANMIRESIINMLLAAGSGHSAGSLGMADVFTALYWEIANITPETRNDPNRDRIVLSNAHICPVLYATLAHRGYFSVEELPTFRKFGSRLQGHSTNHFQPELPIETCGGPLAQGLSQSVGMAIASRMNGGGWHTWCLLGDGELNEGQIWEAVFLAGKMNLRELTIFVDRNNIQIDGTTETVMPLEPLADKFRAFNWSVIDVNGHNIREVVDAANHARAIAENPTVVLCHTIPGKGVDFMENKYEWHGKPPNGEEAERALAELRTFGGRITSEHE